MDKQLESSFNRVEKALGTLIDSIAKYNPSASQVHDLGTADEELTRGLKDLQTHQSNYRRIQELRNTASGLDGQIKDTIRLLANIRKELVNTSPTIFPNGPNYEINYDELLNYARRISKTTLPPAGAINSLPTDSQIKIENGGVETVDTTPGETPNGIQSQAASGTPATNGIQHSFDSTQQTAATGGSSSTTNTNLPEHISAHLNPHSGFEFVPWPSEEQVRRGAIASLSYIAEQGIDAENYDPEEEKARKEREEEERRQREDRERTEREQRERRMREEQARLRAERERNREKEEAEGWRRASVSTGGGPGVGNVPPGASASQQPPRPTEKAKFQFMGGDDDDSDSDKD